jgi:transposase
VHTLLVRRGVQASYATVRRFAMQELGWHKKKPTIRLEDPPAGQEAQVDFGRMGYLVDPETGRRRKLWALIVTLSFSRYQFVWPTFHQTTEAICEGLDQAWWFFGAVPVTIVPDNSTADCTRASVAGHGIQADQSGLDIFGRGSEAARRRREDLGHHPPVEATGVESRSTPVPDAKRARCRSRGEPSIGSGHQSSLEWDAEPRCHDGPQQGGEANVERARRGARSAGHRAPDAVALAPRFVRERAFRSECGEAAVGNTQALQKAGKNSSNLHVNTS